MMRVFMCTIGKVAFSMRPDMFNWVEFGCVARKPVDMYSFGLLQECFDVDSLMDRSVVPDQKNMIAQMAQQVPQKPDDFSTGDVVCVETDVKAHASANGGYSDTTDCRDFIAPVAVAKYWGAARRSPGFPDVRYEQKAAFIQECNMGIKVSGFFLYWAMSCVSKTQWLFRFFARLAVAAFDSSSRNRCAIASIRPRAYIGCRSRHKSTARYALMSRGRCCAHELQHPVTTLPLASPSGPRSEVMVVPILPCSEFPGDHSSDKFDAIEPPNSGMLSILVQQCGRFRQNAALKWLRAAVFLTAWDFHGVSYPIIYIFPLNVSIIS